MGSAMPSFFFGIVLILLFSILPKGAGWPYVPAGLSESVRGYTIPMIGEVDAGSFKDRILHLILPVAVLTFIQIAGWSRFVRASMLEVMKMDYVRTARAKGLPEKKVMMKHVLRNALIPILTNVGIYLPSVFVGSFLLEVFFSIPGLGREIVTAVNRSDFPVIKAVTVYLAMLTMFVNLLVDVMYKLVDPRVSFK